MTLPSSLNMLTSSICAMGCTLSFLSDACNFLSSVPELLCTFFTFRRGVPLPLFAGEEGLACGDEFIAWVYNPPQTLISKGSKGNAGECNEASGSI